MDVDLAGVDSGIVEAQVKQWYGEESARSEYVLIEIVGSNDRTHPTPHPIEPAQQPVVHDRVKRGCTEDVKAPRHTVDGTAMVPE